MTPEAVFHQLADQPGAVWLDSGQVRDGWSILSWDPVEVLTEATQWVTGARALMRAAPPDLVPFASGVIGYLGYGASAADPLFPASLATPEPEVWLARYEGALCYHHAGNRWHVRGPAPFVRRANQLLHSATEPPRPGPVPAGVVSRTLDQHTYASRVRQVLNLIDAGDCYQVNLSRPVWIDQVGNPWSAYRRLRAVSSAPYGAYLRLSKQLAVLCNSPELHLQVSGREAVASPIKGTRPRDPSCDQAMIDELLASAKDRAELTMIVDLVRNDLGRIAVLGSVQTGPRVVHSVANVHHTTQAVRCQIAPACDAWDVLQASFPPGSVTGAPKIRACERIAQLESHPRGVYCGCLGYASDSGNAAFNVAIRTAVVNGTQARYHVGGGIVTDSDPAAEWLETVHKGTALAQSLIGVTRR